MPLVGVAYANGLFVAVAHGKSVTSEDGLTWTTHSQADPNFRYLHDIIYAGGRFLAGADQCVATSIDGTNWVTTRYLNRSLMRLAYGNGNYIGLDIDSQFIHTSQDGETWTGYYLPNPGWVERLTFVNDQFFALGLGGEIMTSSNGMEWARQGQGDSRHLYGVAHGPGEYVAVGEAGTILCSARGDSWSSVGVDTMDNLNCVAYGGKKFVAGGDWGTLLTSTDGTNWLAQEPLGFRQIKSIAYGEGRFVVVGTDGGALAYESTDGVTWNIADYHWNSVYTGIAYGNGRFVAFLCSNYGPYPWVQVSKDGVDWITPEPNFEGYSGVGLVAFGSGHFVAPGNYGDIYTSENGTKWVRRRVKELAYETALSISYGAGKFFITEESGLVVSSPNGIVWTEEKTGSDARLYDMAYGGENCVAVGEYGVILQSHISPTIPDSHLRRQSPVFSARRFMSDSETSISGRSGQQYSPAPVRRQSKDDVRSGD